MKLYNLNATQPTIRPTDSVPIPPDTTTLTPTSENTLTCLENNIQFAHVHAAVHEQFRPPNDFQSLLADDLAESLWVRNRFGAIANQSLNFAIQSNWDDVSKRHPDADPAFRTHLAWNQIATDPAHIRATDIHTRSSRRVQTDIRLLAFVARLR
ncbi:MAG: hypothetical protein HY821_01605 [Acidobacteria bacterium]|nr:hypothetical protein [Acidobacteriota bacterium]